MAFFGFEQPIYSDPREFLLLVGSLSFIAVIHGSIALVIRGFITWFQELKLKEELANKNFEMKLALIKSQIDPHFLFNTINNIDVLIMTNSTDASEYLHKLSDILRYMVYETRKEKISLSDEIGYIKKYVELQKIRRPFPDLISLNFIIEGSIDHLTVAPMIFFPFIENAFKHTENRKKSDHIYIKIIVSKEKIVFECENSYQPSTKKLTDFGGLGNKLIKNRLLLIYPNRHFLEIEDKKAIYQIKLTLI